MVSDEDHDGNNLDQDGGYQEYDQDQDGIVCSYTTEQFTEKFKGWADKIYAGKNTPEKTVEFLESKGKTFSIEQRDLILNIGKVNQ